MKVLIAAGGTGGHLFPAQQLVAMLQPDTKIHFAGHKLAASPFFEKGGVSFTEIEAHPLKRGFFQATWKGFWTSKKLIETFAPDVVVGFGSFHVFPLLLAAFFLRKKLILFEPNCVLGKVNRFFRFAATRIAFQFPIGFGKKELLVPLLPWTISEEKLDPKEARRRFGLDSERNTLLVFGGSQGASFLNEVAPLAVKTLKESLQVIHLTGQKEEEKVRSSYAKFGIPAFVKDFEKKMRDAYAAADLAFCRSGAGTVAELIRFEVPSLLIPYPFATEGHQKKNGDFLVQKKGARLLLQEEASVEKISKEVEDLLREKTTYQAHLKKMHLESQNRLSLAEFIRGM